MSKIPLTAKGSMTIRLNETQSADQWRSLISVIIGAGVRWQTSKILALGAFPSDITTDRGSNHYSKFDCFFALGGFDNRSTYIMIAKVDHDAVYGAGDGRFGRVTKGRHLLKDIQEGENILDIRPVIVEVSEKDVFVTSDLSTELEEDMSIETYVGVKLDKASIVSCEQFLVVTDNNILETTDRTASYVANSSRPDVTLVPEAEGIRDVNDVTVRHEGSGTGQSTFIVSADNSQVRIIILGK